MVTESQKKSACILGGILLFLILPLGGIYLLANKANEEYFSREGMVLCTMDAKICPDGSSVGRHGPNCEFAPCPPLPNLIISETGSTSESSQIPPPPIVKGGGGASGRKVVCTMDVKICPDGSSVGRHGPNCEFAPCPSASPQEGATSGSCTQNSDCAPGYSCIDTSPVVREGSQNLHCWKDGAPHPICLSGETMIATPAGELMVKNIKAGDVVWSIDAKGEKIAVPVQIAAHTAAPPDHHVVHLRLSDGRELFVSPGHPLATGETVGSLRVGDTVDGAFVKSATLILYKEKYTYDILPGSETRSYIANGILLKSTLSPFSSTQNN